MNNPPPIITLTTDFGTSDAYVGVMKGVILNINPDVHIVDITHAVPPQDVHEAAFLIHSAHRYFPEGTIHIIVVDPGVGSDRRAIAYQTERASFVCPDNGILSYLLQETESEEEQSRNVVAIQNRAYFLPEVSQTFHGRDIFAPVAAHLSLGVPLADFGRSVQDLVRLRIPAFSVSDDKLTGQIIKIDRFGNTITNIPEDALPRSAFTYEIRIGQTRLTRINRAYAESEVGELLAIVGSFGMLEIAVNGGDAAERLGLKRGDSVVISIL
ncbi:MAG: SAM-dependent chlorinase/fluorinase [Candidatus Poribacteria bacterium]|nr:SAM-dependent chlorinase/fluorinase [Candidatus Poribacteria bacterium]